MFKVVCVLLFKFIMLFVVAGILTWLYGVFGSNPFFIFFVIIISGVAVDRQAKQIKYLQERVSKLEGFTH